MKVQVTFKTPDVLDYVLDDLDEDNQEILKRLAEKYIKWGELVTLEFDLKNETVKVLEV